MTCDEAHGDADAYWRQWAQPPTVIALAVAAVTLYGSYVLQSERLDAMRAKVEAIERDYSRRDVLAEQLRNVEVRLFAIEKVLIGDALAIDRDRNR